MHNVGVIISIVNKNILKVFVTLYDIRTWEFKYLRIFTKSRDLHG